jgi:hypothetical protein
MIIKNNFNDRNANPLDDYSSIGKGSHSLEKELERERQGFIKANMENKVLEDLRDNHDDEEDREDEDKWKFFR